MLNKEINVAFKPMRELLAKLPMRLQRELRRLHYWRRIRNRTFISEEPEFSLLDAMILPGDCVIDIGANVGFYTRRFAELVGQKGRVIAFEPVPETFAQLANNLDICGLNNTTLINAAVSEHPGFTGMIIPSYPDVQQLNYYQAHLSADEALQVLAVNLDAFPLPVRIALIKIDVEGNEMPALKGMHGLLRRDHPILIVETSDQDVWDFLASIGYVGKALSGSPNVLFHCGDQRVIAL